MPTTSTDYVSDSELVARITARDARAFEALYERYNAQAFGLAMYITGRRCAAEEVTQDAFLSLWRTASRYDPNRGSLKTWLLSVVRNRGIDSVRQAARHQRDVEITDAITERLEASDRTEEQVINQEQSHHTRASLSGLPRAQHEVIELGFFNGLTQLEIAAKLGVPLGTVKGRQRLALRKLQRTLGGTRQARSAADA